MAENEEFDFSHYYTYDEMASFLKKMQEKHGDLAKLHSIGKSGSGRDLWLMEITNFKTGPGEDKPGYYIDGNMHASEVVGSMVCLYTIWYLLKMYGRDEFITNLLDSKVFYILPRVDVDGAELFLTTPQIFYSAAKFYPFTEEEWMRKEGLHPEDVDGDGQITMMRIKDPNGLWKVSEKDPRLMIRRGIGESGGTYYNLYIEGVILNYKGGEIKYAPPKYGMNLNRNFPGDWVPDVLGGSGPTPMSEPEVRAIVDFWLSHPNIGGMVTYHTHGGIIVRAFDNKPDSEFIEKDLILFKTIGAIGTEITGYPLVSSFEELTRDKKKPRHGCSDAWAYISRGVPGFCVELWDLAKHAGLGGFRERGGVYFRLDALKEEDALKPLQWLDKELNGQGFVNWHPFKHPQLGDVEIGGYALKFTWRNPPPGKFMEEECKRVFMFPLKHASLLPSVKISSAKAIKVAPEVYRIEVMVENVGFLPTNISEQALQIKVVKPITVSIELGEDASLLIGQEWIEIDHLKGLFDKLPELPSPVMDEGSKKKVEWIVRAAKPTKVKVTVRSEKGGKDTKEIQLE